MSFLAGLARGDEGWRGQLDGVGAITYFSDLTPLMPSLKIISFCLIGAGAAFFACQKTPVPGKDRIVIRYWEKWTGFEADAMRVVVNDFNASQDRIFVDYTSGQSDGPQTDAGHRRRSAAGRGGRLRPE